jgi:hypothetical protein
MEDDQNFFSFKWKTTTFSYKVKLAFLALASLELGTAQPKLLFSGGTIHPPTARPYGLATVKYLKNHLLDHYQILNLGSNDQIKGYTCFK